MESAREPNSGRKQPVALSAPDPPTFGNPIPCFTVNLSLAPHDRYTHIPSHLPDLLNDALSNHLTAFVSKSASLFLRRLYSDEETAELLGISRVTSIPIWLLVAFNVLLDLLLGCTSGGFLGREAHGAWAEMRGSQDASVSHLGLGNRIPSVSSWLRGQVVARHGRLFRVRRSVAGVKEGAQYEPELSAIS